MENTTETSLKRERDENGAQLEETTAKRARLDPAPADAMDLEAPATSEAAPVEPKEEKEVAPVAAARATRAPVDLEAECAQRPFTVVTFVLPALPAIDKALVVANLLAPDTKMRDDFSDADLDDLSGDAAPPAEDDESDEDFVADEPSSDGEAELEALLKAERADAEKLARQASKKKEKAKAKAKGKATPAADLVKAELPDEVDPNVPESVDSSGFSDEEEEDETTAPMGDKAASSVIDLEASEASDDDEEDDEEEEEEDDEEEEEDGGSEGDLTDAFIVLKFFAPEQAAPTLENALRFALQHYNRTRKVDLLVLTAICVRGANKKMDALFEEHLPAELYKATGGDRGYVHCTRVVRGSSSWTAGTSSTIHILFPR